MEPQGNWTWDRVGSLLLDLMTNLGGRPNENRVSGYLAIFQEARLEPAAVAAAIKKGETSHWDRFPSPKQVIGLAKAEGVTLAWSDPGGNPVHDLRPVPEGRVLGSRKYDGDQWTIEATGPESIFEQDAAGGQLVIWEKDLMQKCVRVAGCLRFDTYRVMHYIPDGARPEDCPSWDRATPRQYMERGMRA